MFLNISLDRKFLGLRIELVCGLYFPKSVEIELLSLKNSSGYTNYYVCGGGVIRELGLN